MGNEYSREVQRYKMGQEDKDVQGTMEIEKEVLELF
jgi:hypothetical protein